MVTYTSNKGLIVPAPGEFTSSWASPANTNYTLIDTAIAGITSVDCTGAADITLSGTDGIVNQARSFILVLTGTPTTQLSVLVPDNDTSHYDVRSKVTNSQVIVINNAAKTGAGCTIAPSEAFGMYTDGVRCHKLGVVPKGTVMFWTGTTLNIPAGWQAFTEGYNRFVKMGSPVVSVAATQSTVSLGTPITGSTAIVSLTEAQMPKHDHHIPFTTLAVTPGGAGTGFTVTFNNITATTSAGEGGGHSHSLVGSHTHPISVVTGGPMAYQMIPIRKYT